MAKSLSRVFAQYVSPLTYADLPHRVVDKLKASLLHAMVTSIVGAETSHGQSAIALVKAEESRPDGATILVDGGRASRCGAAFANSKLMHATNQTDSYRMLIHPGPCVIPAALATAEARLDRAMRDLDRAKVRAPYAGRVRRKNVDVGQFVTVGSPVATIYAVDYAEIRLPLPDAELAYLELPLSYRGTENRVGPRVTLRANFAGQTHEWQGRIVRTESEIDPMSRMVHVVAQVKDPYAPGTDPTRPPLAVGMYVEAEIEGNLVTAVAVLPRAALRGSSQVLVVDGESRLRFRDVDLLRTTAEAILVRAGLEEGEAVSLSPLEVVTDGMLVQILGDIDILGNAAGLVEEAP